MYRDRTIRVSFIFYPGIALRQRENYLFRELFDEKTELERLLNIFAVKRTRIIEQIESMSNNKHMIVLSMLYLECKELWEIPNETHYSYSYVKKLHSNALWDFEKLYGQEYLKEKA